MITGENSVTVRAKRNKMIGVECGKQVRYPHHVIPKSKKRRRTVPLSGACHIKVQGCQSLHSEDLLRAALQCKPAGGEKPGGKSGFMNLLRLSNVKKIEKMSKKPCNKWALFLGSKRDRRLLRRPAHHWRCPYCGQINGSGVISPAANSRRTMGYFRQVLAWIKKRFSVEFLIKKLRFTRFSLFI